MLILFCWASSAGASASRLNRLAAQETLNFIDIFIFADQTYVS